MKADRVIDAIVALHAEEAAFLHCQRHAAVRSPRLALRNVAAHDNRLSAHVDALRVAGEAGWKACEALLAEADPGALFTAMVLALEGKCVQRIESMLSLAEEAPPLQRGLVSAFGWISASFLQGTAKEMLGAASPFRRRVGIACCAMHGVDPGQSLSTAIGDADPALKARALRAAGELGRSDLLPAFDRGLAEYDSVCRFAATWSAVLLGNRGKALDVLTRIGLEAGPGRRKAFRLMLQAMKLGASHGVLQQLGGDPQQIRWLIEGSGIAGDPKYVPWLIGHMDNEKTARLAGEAFGLITGVDLGQSSLEGDQPENFEPGPNDDSDDPNVDMDPDEGLPWPDPKKVEIWWAANASLFQAGTRYFMGALLTREHCLDVLKNGYQRQRILAARYLCLFEPGMPLFNTSAPAWRQQRLLAKMT